MHSLLGAFVVTDASQMILHMPQSCEFSGRERAAFVQANTPCDLLRDCTWTLPFHVPCQASFFVKFWCPRAGAYRPDMSPELVEHGKMRLEL